MRISKFNLMRTNLGQVGIEYLLIVGFVTFAVIAILASAYYYNSMARSAISVEQAERAMKKIISSAESVFYSGEPSKSTITIYLPQGIKNITIQNKDIILEMRANTGIMKRAFSSKVVLQGSISTLQGTKRISIIAQQDKVTISQVV